MRYRYINGYKYKTCDGQEFDVPEFAGAYAALSFVCIADGKMQVNAHYAWDGTSGPTKDDDTNILPSLVHDCLYQLMREGVLDRKHQNLADRVMRRMCLEQGMNPFRAWCYYHALKLFGRSHTFPKENDKLGKIFITGV